METKDKNPISKELAEKIKRERKKAVDEQKLIKK